jgi:hypothetical protein
MSILSLGGALGGPGEACMNLVNAKGSRPHKGALPKNSFTTSCHILKGS